MRCSFEAIEEDVVGHRWRRLWERHWPGYQGWFLRGGLSGRPSYLECRSAIRTHMPHWEPVWEQMISTASGGDIESRFLSLWCPPAYIAGCSQAVWVGRGGPGLVRNYDYSPSLLEGAWMSTRWCGQRVVAMSDCLCGALDGINESGVAMSLSFGGRKTRGVGFGIPLLLRYALEMSTTTREAVCVLTRIPVHMTYSVTVVDKSGSSATVYIAPDRTPEIVPHRGATNHQNAIEWPEHARATNTVARGEALRAALTESASLEDLLGAMARPPLYQSSYARGYGTLYTAVYRPQALTAELVWPDGGWCQALGAFKEGTRIVELAAAAPVAAQQPLTA